jgi:hypothetical protein
MSARSFLPPLLIGTLSDHMSLVCLKGLNFSLKVRSHVGNALQIWQLQSFVMAIGEGSLRKLTDPVRHTPMAGGRAMQCRMDIRVQTVPETCEMK